MYKNIVLAYDGSLASQEALIRSSLARAQVEEPL